MDVRYSKHLEVRLNFRDISYEIPEKIYNEATERYFDSETKLSVAVKEIEYKGKTRELAVIYDELGQVVSLVTIHPLKVNQKNSRIKSGRWVSRH